MKHRLTILLLVVVGLVSTRPAHGARAANSIEWMMADAELVVRGRVIKVEQIISGNNENWELIRLKIEQTLKGEKISEVKLVARRPENSPGASHFMREKAELLAALRSTKSMSGPRPQLEAAPYTPWSTRAFVPIVLDDATDAHGSEVVQMDGMVLDDRTEILRAAESAAEFSAGRTAPNSLVVAVQQGIRVPVDERLESVARGWAVSPEPAYRKAAVKPLKALRTPDAIHLLKKLADDPHFVMDRGYGKWRIRYYPIRRSAGEALRAIDVRREVIESEPLMPYRPVHWYTALAVAAVLIVTVGGVYILAHRLFQRTAAARAGLPGAHPRTAAVVVALLALCALWIRSHYRIDELSLHIGSANFTIASHRGGFLLTRSADWNADPSIQYGVTSVMRGLEGEWELESFVGTKQLSIPGLKSITAGRSRGPAGEWHPTSALRLSFPWIIVPVAAWQLARLRFACVRKYRTSQGKCPRCGYDLRASHDGCPECGLGRPQAPPPPSGVDTRL